MGYVWSSAPRLELHTTLYNSASPASHSRQDYLCYCLSLSSVGSNKWHLHIMQSLTAFLTRITMNQCSQFNTRCLFLCHQTKAILPKRPSIFKKVGLNEAIVGQYQRAERTKPFSGLSYTQMLLMLQTLFQSEKITFTILPSALNSYQFFFNLSFHKQNKKKLVI